MRLKKWVKFDEFASLGATLSDAKACSDVNFIGLFFKFGKFELLE